MFGKPEENSNSPLNLTILCVKYFIWKSRIQKVVPITSAFKSYFKYKIEELKHAYEYIKKEYLFEPWLVIYDSLLGEE